MDEVLIKRILPHSDEAEQAVIASMLMDKDAVVTAVDMLEKEDFYSTRYGILFEAMDQLSKEGKPADLIQVQDRVRQNGAPPEVSGMEFLREILSSVPTSANIRHYAEIVKNKSILRRLIKTAQTIENECYESKDNIENILYNAEKNITGVTQSGSSEEIQPISEVVIEALDRMQAAAKAGGKITGIATGFTDLDYKMAGLQNSDLVLVAARPSMGKTAFVLNIAHHVAVKKRIPVAIFSLEMSKEQLVTRMIALDSLVNSQKIQTGQLVDDEWDKIMESTEVIADAPIFVDDNSAITVADLRSKCRKLKQNNDLGLIIIDYLQLMSTNKHVESRQQFISDTSRALKVLARELNVPVIALSQLNRAVDSRPDHKPVLADLRESGAIEQDSDVVMFIYRDDYYNPDTEKKGIAEIIIAKQRKGATGSVDLVWMQDYTKFANKERPQM